MLKPAPLESARFGLRTFRATVTSIDTDALFEELVACHVDVAILRLPTRDSNQIQNIERYGLRAIHADTLVSYACRLQEHESKPLQNPGLQIDLARVDDEQAIIALIKAVFLDYPNHYHANPLLDRAAVLDGYCEWALTHIGGDNVVSWVARVDGRLAAIACSSFDASEGVCHGVLHGVHPDFSGSRIYTDLIRHTKNYFRNRGYRLLKISTQVGNLTVQRVWVREGFVFDEAFDTFHINALLDSQRPDLVQTVVRFSSGTRTRNDATMITQFLSAAISISGPVLADFFSTKLDCDAAVFMEVLPGQDYAVRVRRYESARAPGYFYLSATLHDSADRLCGIARFAAPRAGASINRGASA